MFYDMKVIDLMQQMGIIPNPNNYSYNERNTKIMVNQLKGLRVQVGHL